LSATGAGLTKIHADDFQRKGADAFADHRVEQELAALEQKEKELYNQRLYVGRTADQKKKFALEKPYIRKPRKSRYLRLI
jgi:hypothetical protein